MSLINLCSFIVKVPGNKVRIVIAIVMIPRPPSWISARMTVNPKGVKVSCKSTVESPVTHKLLTATNAASTRLMES